MRFPIVPGFHIPRRPRFPAGTAEQFQVYFRPRPNDRTFTYTTPVALIRLDIPPTRGRVRLQLTINSVDLVALVPLAIEWQKPHSLPGVAGLAEQIWSTLTSRSPAPTRRAGLATFPVRLRDWRGTVYVPKADVPDVGYIAAGAPQSYPVLSVREALAFAKRHLMGCWGNDRDKRTWMYRMHRLTAMVVADEIARLYMENRQVFGKYLKYLDAAMDDLRGRIEVAWKPGARVTPRRLALALVDAKFDHLSGPGHESWKLLGNRMKLYDGQLWSRFMEPEKERRIRALCPTPRVRDLVHLRKAEYRDNPAASWFLSWWTLIVAGPLYPFKLDMRYTDEWPSYVWEALYPTSSGSTST